MATKARVAILFGGRSSEHEISCATAASVLAQIDRDRFEVAAIGIAGDGQWVRVPDDPELYRLHDGQGATIQSGKNAISVIPGRANFLEAVIAQGEVSAATELGEVDVVLPLLHGPYGEDGTVQGLLEMLNLPYVGCGVTASALCMDKHLTKTVLNAHGINVGRWVSVTAADWAHDREAVLGAAQALSGHVFVKPARAGSSVGISSVTDLSLLPEAIETALMHDPRIVIEAATPGLEVECAVLQSREGPARTSTLGAIGISGGGFYDYETKYVPNDRVQLQIPAPISPEVASRVQDIAAQTFAALQCEGLARVDFFVNGEDIVVNEVNTMPGFTPFSMYPALWEHSGIGYQQLVSELIDLAMSRPLGLR